VEHAIQLGGLLVRHLPYYTRKQYLGKHLTFCGLIELYLPCVKTGVIFVPINILHRDREISHILRDAEPRAVISDEPLVASTAIWTRAQVRAAIQGNKPTRPAVRLDADSPAGIIYTSGTKTELRRGLC
jgi:acyl-CoA synthetase (AMP-forming)/AMP-acid ligase II